MASLYELKEAYAQIQELIEDGGDYEGVLATITDEIEVKAENYAIVMKNMEGDIAAIKKEIKRLKARQTVLENGIERMKKNLTEAMIETGKKKFKTAKFSFTIAAGGMKPLILDEKIPKKYMIVKTEPDKKQIREDLEAGKKLKFARFGERKESLRIR